MSSQAQVIAVDKPLVSVVMPVHNGERFLDEAIWSIRNHTLTQLELIIVENGSTDRYHEVAVGHATNDPRVRVIQRGLSGSSLQ